MDILLIEDNPADIKLFQEALKERRPPCRVSVLTQLSEVEDFVAQAGSAALSAPPQLIVSDYLMHGMEAADMLAMLRRLPGYNSLPVILFSALPEREGQRQCTSLHTTAFVYKPGELQAYYEAIAAIVHQWGSESFPSCHFISC